MSVLWDAVGELGWKRLEVAAIVWAGRVRRDGERCAPLVAAWHRAFAEVIYCAVAMRGIEGLHELSHRVVLGVEAPRPVGDALDLAVADWTLLSRALDSQTGTPSCFPHTVVSDAHLSEIASLARELDRARARRSLSLA